MSVRRVKNHGHWRWLARVQYRGRQASRMCATADAAKLAEADLLIQLQTQAAEQAAATVRPVTLKEALEAYAEDLLARGKDTATVGRVEWTARAVEALMPALLAKPVPLADAEIFAFRTARLREGKVVRELLAGAKVERRGPAKPSTINRDLRTLRATLKLACPGYRFPAGAFLKEDETRVRWLRPEEEITVFESMPSPFREIARLAALALMRLSEVRLLRRESVHLELGVLLLPKTKTGPVQVILSEAAQKILRTQLEAHPDSEWVFPGPHGRPYSREQIGRVFRRAARSAGLTDFHFHDLKHHGATMAASRFPDRVVMKLGRWKSPKMVERYAAVTDPTLRAAAEVVAGHEPWPGRPADCSGPLQRPRKSARDKGRA